MMGRDEPGTLRQLKASRELMVEEIGRHRGRVFATAGDSLLAEFSSVVNAVECAVRIQRGLAERNAGLPEANRMLFRIGINLGDVLIEGDDLFGDGVNIAARLQALAEPGGILISGAVFEQVRTKLSLAFDALGPQPVRTSLSRFRYGGLCSIQTPTRRWLSRRPRCMSDMARPRRPPQPVPCRTLPGGGAHGSGCGVPLRSGSSLSRSSPPSISSLMRARCGSSGHPW